MNSEGAGKGDTYRPVNRDKFNSNFETINWNKLTSLGCPLCDWVACDKHGLAKKKLAVHLKFQHPTP